MTTGIKVPDSLPWKYDHTNGDIRGAKDKYVGIMCADQEPDAGAYLTHAANLYPELVTALECMTSYVQKQSDKEYADAAHTCTRHCDDRAEALTDARAIIAKCKGGEE